MDTKCAPGVNFENGSCINKETLENIADNFNQKLHHDFPNLRFHICCLCNISYQ